jgi:prolyl 4-hydroxylase
MRFLLPLLCVLLPLLQHAVDPQQAVDCTVEEDGTCTSSSIDDDEETAECVNSNEEQCPLWASWGHCFSNPKYMLYSCQMSCDTCSKSDQELQQLAAYRIKCPFDRHAPTSVVVGEEGDLNKLFESIADEDDAPEKKLYATSVLSKEPWIIQLDDFLTQDECDLLIKWGHHQGFERSIVAADEIHAGGRTSASAWCYGAACLGATKLIMDKIEKLVHITSDHYEWLQILQYKEGQFYGEHHDYDPRHLQQQCGPRILTLFLYLNDVDEGGWTNFNLLNVTVQPKPGRALLWPSVLNEDIWERDNRTTHQALPVEMGVKYGANVWIHARDYKGLASKGCLR